MEPKGPGVKTLGIRLPDELHAQFALVAQLDGLSLTDAVKRAVEFYVGHKRAEGDFATRATTALEGIEREAAARRGAIQALFGSGEATQAAGADAPQPEPPASGDMAPAEAGAAADTAGRRGRRRGGESSG
jgi:hypothetical protein